MNKTISLFSIILFAIFLAIPAVIAVPQYTGYVNDYAGILADWKPQIEELITAIEKETTAEIAVVTIDSLEDRNLEEYSLEIAQTWGVGKEDKDNGLLLLISFKDKKYRFETGYGLEGTLPDAKTGRIGRQILTPYFQQGRYGQGVYEAVKEIKGLLANDPTIVSKYDEKQDPLEEYAGFFVLGYALILLATLILTEKLQRHKWKIRAGIDIAIIISGIAIGALAFVFAFMTSIFFWMLIFQITMMKLRGKGPGGLGGFWWGGGLGGSSGGSSGGFGGFGGGSFGGGGSSGGW